MPAIMVHLDQIKYCYLQRGEVEKHFHLGTFSLDIVKGELLVVLGPSGSGKTTLLRLIAGLERPKQGRIVIDGEVVFNGTRNVLPEKRQVGMMFQDHALFPHLTARQNILFGIRHWPAFHRDDRIAELECLLALEDYRRRYPHELSGGQQQRVALARTLAPNPKIILLDEPLGSMDADLRTSLSQELRRVLKQIGTTAVWVTHDQTEALDLADRILVINEGQIEQIDDPWHLYNQPKTRFVADFVGHAVFLKGEVKGAAIVTEMGTLPCPPCLQHSRCLEVMVRPNDVRAVVNGAGLGTVLKRQFFGSMQLYAIELPSGQQILTTQPSRVNWPVGTKVQLQFDTKSVVAFPV